MTQPPDDSARRPDPNEPPVYGTPPSAGPPGGRPPPGYGPPPGYSSPPRYGSPPAGGPIGPSGVSIQEERQWALFAHLGGVLAIFPVIHLLPALGILAIYGSRSEFVKDQAREALNFQIVVLIAYFAARIIGALPFFPSVTWIVWTFSLVFSVLAAVVASKGGRYRYPLTYRFLG